MMGIRGRIGPIILVISLTALAGCTSDSRGTAPPPGSSSTPSGSPIDGKAAASAVLGGFRVTVPAGSTNGSGTLTATAAPDAPATAAGLRRVGSGVHVDLGGAQLKAPATVTFAISAHWDKNLLPIVAWEDGHGGWRWLPTSWKPGQTTATAQTDHFSTGFLGSLDVGAEARAALARLGNWFTGRADVAQPACGSESAVRTKIRISSDGGDSVKWCLGSQDGKTVLKIANNRLSYTQLTYPSSWKVLSGQRYGISLDALVQFTATKAASALQRRGRSTILIEAGKSVTFAVPGTGEASVVAQNSFYAYALQILGLALDIETKVAKLAGIELKKNGIDRLIGIITGESTLDEWGKAGRDCLRSMSSEFTSDLTEPVELDETAKQVFTVVSECVVAMGKVSASESGPLIFPLSVVLDAVMTIVTTVITAVKLLIIGVREVWDSLASFGGRSNPIYTIRMTPRSQPTEIVNINPFTATGAVKAGYAVETADGLLDCTPYVEASPSAVRSNIYACGTTAANADVCWIERGAADAICGVDPWDHKLRKWSLAGWPVPDVNPPPDPLPWGLVLADGTKCRRRIGGSWSGRPDGWVASYGCVDKSFVVLADPNNDYQDLDKTKPTWIVRVGELSDTAKTLPPPRPVAVRTAYFATRN
ncbi:hypothetical protein ACQPYH_11620 [Kribbella sp. CA-245084]|uniref:hypothetical protein n=1 Tax=Kribbella sp. CA-245084 TaxID=3239940 RepID=UPI003D8DA506